MDIAGNRLVPVPEATPRSLVRRAARTLIALAAVSGVVACAAGQRNGSGAPAIGEETPPEHSEQVLYALWDMPGAGWLRVYEMPNELDVEFTLYFQRIRWTAEKPGGTMIGLGWADYRGRCERQRVTPRTPSTRRAMMCMAPFQYFWVMRPEGDARCFDNVDLERPLCPGDGPAYEALDHAFAMGRELVRHALEGKDSFSGFRPRLSKLFAETTALRELFGSA